MADYIITNTPAFFGGVESVRPGTFDPDYAAWSTELTDDREFGVPLYGLNDVWVQFGVWVESGAGYYEDGHMWRLPYAGGSNFWKVNLNSGNYSVRRLTSNSSAEVTENFAMPKNTLVVVDFHIVKDDPVTPGNTVLEIYFDGALVYSFSGDRDTLNTHVIGDVLYLGGHDYLNSGDYAYYSNLRVSDSDTRGRRFRAVPVATAGFYDEFENGLASLLGGGNIFSGTAGQRVSGSLDFAAIPDLGAPSAIKLSSTIYSDGAAANPNALQHFARIGGTNYDVGSATSPGGAREELVTTLSTNPATGLAWTHADLGTVEFGLLSSHIL